MQPGIITPPQHAAAIAEAEASLLLEAVLDAARRAGADAAEAVLVAGRALEARVRLGGLESLERDDSFAIGLRVFIDGRQAHVSTASRRMAALRELAARAVAMARVSPPDPHAGLAPPDLLHADPSAGEERLALADGADPGPSVLEELARAAEEAARADPRITNSGGAGASAARARRWHATTDGFFAAGESTSYGLWASVMAGAGDAGVRDYASHASRHLGDLESPEVVGTRARRRTLARLGARSAPTGRHPVLFEPRVARTLVGHLAAAINGERIARGTSFLKDALGEPVFAPDVAVIDDPLRPRGLRSRAFDAEGVATRRREIVRGGRLLTWLLDSATSRELGRQTTGHACRSLAEPPSPAPANFYLAPGTRTPTELMREAGRGLVVTELIGQGVNLVTGDYSRGAAGFWFEDGEIAWPVHEITIAGHMKDMFRTLVPADDLEFRYGIDSPTLLIPEMTVAGRAEGA
ncbi:MAG: modulator protein [Rhodothalassiaceae bacterium]|nr:MAG: modulator protein [Rhodothalassiaceae bacterium]